MAYFYIINSKLSFFRALFYSIIIGTSYIPLYTVCQEVGAWVIFGIVTFLIIVTNSCVLKRKGDESSYEAQNNISFVLFIFIFFGYVQFSNYFLYINNYPTYPPVVITEILGVLITYDILIGLCQCIWEIETHCIIYVIFIVLTWIGYIIYNVFLDNWGVSSIFASIYSFTLFMRMGYAYSIDKFPDERKESGLFCVCDFLSINFWALHLAYFLVICTLSMLLCLFSLCLGYCCRNQIDKLGEALESQFGESKMSFRRFGQ